MIYCHIDNVIINQVCVGFESENQIYNVSTTSILRFAGLEYKKMWGSKSLTKYVIEMHYGNCRIQCFLSLSHTKGKCRTKPSQESKRQ